MNDIINLLNNVPLINGEIFESSYCYKDTIVPRVTKIIGACISSDYLLYWANSLGFKRQSYSKTVKEAAEIGTQCHETIDQFIDNDFNFNTPNNMHNKARYAYESYLRWWNDLHLGGNIVKVIFHEYPLVCKYFGGTIDGLYEINGKKYIVDYKTSNHITFRYLLQIAAYRYILREEYHIEADGCIILQLSKNDISYNEYVLNFDIAEHLQYINDCEQAFLSMVYTYYNILKVESDYKNMQWG